MTLIHSMRRELLGMRNHLRALPPQRRRLLIGAALTLAALAISLLLQAALRYAHQSRARLDQELALLHWLQGHAQQARQLQAATAKKTGDTISLLALASNTAKEHELAFQRYEPAADGKLSLWLSDTDFNALLSWLDDIVRQHDVRIERLAISQSKQPGTVEAQIVLWR